MAVNGPIWPGSSSFFPGSGQTPFGFYDTDVEFAAEADQVADWLEEPTQEYLDWLASLELEQGE